MRLAHVVPTYLPAQRYGGPIYSVHGLCRALVARGHEVHVYTTSVDGSRDSDVAHNGAVDLDGVAVHYFRARWPRRLYYAPSMARALRHELHGFHVVHLHSVFLWPTALAAQVSRRLDRPYLVSPRGMLVPELIAAKGRLRKRMWIAAIEQHNLRRARAIHATSEVERTDCLRMGLSLPPVFVVPNGVDETMVPPADPPANPDLPPPQDQTLYPPSSSPFPNVLYLGRVSWKKRVGALVEACSAIPEVCLTVAGNDEEQITPGLRRLAKRLGLGERVSFVGAVNGPEKARLFARARMMVLPSHSENFGNVVLEAAAARCPVILTSGAGVADAVKRWDAGVLCDGSPSGLADAIQYLVDNPKEARRLGENGRRMVTEAYGWSRVAQQMEDHYRAVR